MQAGHYQVAYSKRRTLTKKVRSRLNHLEARKECLQSEHIDDNFRDKTKRRFRVHRKGTPGGSRLLINDNISTNQKDIIAAWATHFETLGVSKLAKSASLQQLLPSINLLQTASIQNEDLILDTPVTFEEIEVAVAKLKRGKSCGLDGIVSEHIIYGGPTFKLWLKKVCNAIIDLEVVPPSFLKAVIVPIYKGKGKDPLSTNNYRGISLTSVIGKLFERIVLQRMTPGSFGRDGNSTLHTDSISSRNLLLRSNRGGPGSCQKPYTTWINSVPMFLRSGKGIRFCGVLCSP